MCHYVSLIFTFFVLLFQSNKAPVIFLASQRFDQTFSVLDQTGWTGAFSRTQQKQTSAHEAEFLIFSPLFKTIQQ